MKSVVKLLASLAVCAACGLWVPLAAAEDVQLKIDWSQKRWDGYPHSLDKVTSEWKDNKLYVHAVVIWTPPIEISDKNPHVFIQGNKLRLCYIEGPDPKLVGRPIPPALAPVLLEFVITGIPRRKYQIEVPHPCE